MRVGSAPSEIAEDNGGRTTKGMTAPWGGTRIAASEGNWAQVGNLKRMSLDSGAEEQDEEQETE